MFNTGTKKISGLMNKEVSVKGRFFPNDTSSPSATYNVGRGWSVVRADVGKFTVTFTDVGTKVLNMKADIQLPVASLADIEVKICEIDLSAKTMTIQTYKTSDGTTAEEPSAYDANQSISFEVSFIDSGVDY
ncbi:MAG: hypothetical protein GY861_01065 [bacterium]|nr:hypothetical protein [bacterium]